MSRSGRHLGSQPQHLVEPLDPSKPLIFCTFLVGLLKSPYKPSANFRFRHIDLNPLIPQKNRAGLGRGSRSLFQGKVEERPSGDGPSPSYYRSRGGTLQANFS